MYYVFSFWHAGSSLPPGLFVGRGQQGLLSAAGQGVPARRLSGQSPGFLWAPPDLCPAGSGRHLGSAAQACGCGAGAELLLSPWGLPGWNPCLLHRQAASSPLGPRGGPLHWAIQHCVITAVSSPEHHPECGLEAVLPPPSNWKVAGCLALSENYRSPGV